MMMMMVWVELYDGNTSLQTHKGKTLGQLLRGFMFVNIMLAFSSSRVFKSATEKQSHGGRTLAVSRFTQTKQRYGAATTMRREQKTNIHRPFFPSTNEIGPFSHKPRRW